MSFNYLNVKRNTSSSSVQSPPKTQPTQPTPKPTTPSTPPPKPSGNQSVPSNFQTPSPPSQFSTPQTGPGSKPTGASQRVWNDPSREKVNQNISGLTNNYANLVRPVNSGLDQAKVPLPAPLQESISSNAKKVQTGEMSQTSAHLAEAKMFSGQAVEYAKQGDAKNAAIYGGGALLNTLGTMHGASIDAAKRKTGNDNWGNHPK